MLENWLTTMSDNIVRVSAGYKKQKKQLLANSADACDDERNWLALKEVT